MESNLEEQKEQMASDNDIDEEKINMELRHILEDENVRHTLTEKNKTTEKRQVHYTANEIEADRSTSIVSGLSTQSVVSIVSLGNVSDTEMGVTLYSPPDDTGTIEIDTAESSSDDEFEGPPSEDYKATFLELFDFPRFSTLELEEPIATEHAEEKSEEAAPEPLQEEKSETQLPRKSEDKPEDIKKDKEGESQEIISEEESEKSLLSSSASSFGFHFEDAIEVMPAVVPIDDQLQIAMDFLMGVVDETVRDERTVSFLERMEQERALLERQQIVKELLYRAVDNAVDVVEYMDEEKLLRLTLDRVKLFREMQASKNTHMLVKYINTELNQKMYTYYRRAHQNQYIKPLPIDKEYMEFNRQKEVLLQLDHFKQQAVGAKKKASDLVSSVKMDLEFEVNGAAEVENALEQRIRTVLNRKDAPHLSNFVEIELRRMRQVRDEVSDSRLRLIAEQHKLGRLCERKRSFEQITNTLTMDTYLVTQREVDAMGIKAEERAHELNRIRERCKTHINQIACIREKTDMTRANLRSAKHELETKYVLQNNLKTKLQNLKIEHLKITELKKDLNHQSGLLYNTSLLYDYDSTVEMIKDKQQNVRILRENYLELFSRIEALEKRCASAPVLPSIQPKGKHTRKKLFPKDI